MSAHADVARIIERMSKHPIVRLLPSPFLLDWEGKLVYRDSERTHIRLSAVEYMDKHGLWPCRFRSQLEYACVALVIGFRPRTFEPTGTLYVPEWMNRVVECFGSGKMNSRWVADCFAFGCESKENSDALYSALALGLDVSESVAVVGEMIGLRIGEP